MRPIGLLLAAQLLYGQNTGAQSGDRVLYFANTDSRPAMQQINNAIEAITSIPAALDSTQRTLEVSGTANQIELAEWVFNELDRPAIAQAPQSPNSTTYTEQLPNGKTLTEVVRVFYFTNSTSPKRIQEKVNTIRAIAGIVRLMPVDERSAIVLRGSVDRIGLAEWLFHELNQRPTAQQSGVLQYRLPPATADPDHSDLTRIFYLDKGHPLIHQDHTHNAGSRAQRAGRSRIGQSSGGCGKTGSAVRQPFIEAVIESRPMLV